MNLNFPSLTGKSSGTIDASTLVSKTQAVFDEFSKSIKDPYLAAAFDNMGNIRDLNQQGKISVTGVTMWPLFCCQFYFLWKIFICLCGIYYQVFIS